MGYTFDANTVSDLHKDARGYRPTVEFSMLWELSDDAGKQALWDELLAELAQSIDAEAEAERIAIEDFEIGIDCELSHGAQDRTEAIQRLIRSIMSKTELVYGGEYACFRFGLPFSFRTELDPIVAQMQQAA